MEKEEGNMEAIKLLNSAETQFKGKCSLQMIQVGYVIGTICFKMAVATKTLPQLITITARDVTKPPVAAKSMNIASLAAWTPKKNQC